MGNRFTRKLKFGSTPDKDEKGAGAEGETPKKGAAEAEANAKVITDSSLDKRTDKTGSGGGESEVKVETIGGTTGGAADTDDVKVTVAKEGGAEIPKINIQDEGEVENEVDMIRRKIIFEKN